MYFSFENGDIPLLCQFTRSHMPLLSNNLKRLRWQYFNGSLLFFAEEILTNSTVLCSFLYLDGGLGDFFKVVVSVFPVLE